MILPAIPGKRTVFSASGALKLVGDAIHTIKSEDGLTWADMSAVFGKSPDQVAKYADGTATMDVVTYARGKREWNGRFTGGLDRLCVESRPGGDSDRQRGSKVLAAALAVSHRLEDDDEVTAREVAADRRVLEEARDALDELLRKPALRSVA